jgi:glycosyltransferase involved in cell wall biosynthesis
LQRKPQIAFFLPDLRGGGAEKVLSILANELAGRGLGIDFVLVKATGVHLKTLSENVRVVELGSVNSYLSLPGLIRYLRAMQPDVLYSSLDLTNLIALIARRLSGVNTRTVVRIANTISHQKRVFWKKGLEKVLFSWIYPWADDVIAVSESVAKDISSYAGISPLKIHVVYNPVITPGLLAEANELTAHPWFQVRQAPVILSVGRFSEQKDFDTLIRAFALLRKRLEARLIILGEGGLRPGLVSLAQSLGIERDLDLPGYVENPHPYMRQADAFVLSSKWEGLPNALIEALACGCPVISTDCPGGIREILADGAYGELVPVGDPPKMAEAIGRVLLKGRRSIAPGWLDRFSLEKVVDQTIDLIGLPVG